MRLGKPASLAQAYLAAKAGADIAAIFNGPLDQAEDTMHDMIAPIRQICANFGFPTKILVCIRYPRLFGEIAVAGADICTMKRNQGAGRLPGVTGCLVQDRQPGSHGRRHDNLVGRSRGNLWGQCD